MQGGTRRRFNMRSSRVLGKVPSTNTVAHIASAAGRRKLNKHGRARHPDSLPRNLPPALHRPQDDTDPTATCLAHPACAR